MYETETMSLDYCGQMCQGIYDSNFMGVQAKKCYCLNTISGSLLLSNRACKNKCPGDQAELCGGEGSLSIHQLNNDSFTDVLSLVSGSFDGVKNEVNIILENGTECIDNDIPFLSGEVENRGVTVIEDHTIVACGGKLNTGYGMNTLPLIFHNIFHSNICRYVQTNMSIFSLQVKTNALF